MTICPVYEGSVKISWYPVIAVLKTTSPDRSAGAPKLLPSKTVPSSRARIAESNNFLLGIGVNTIVRQGFGQNRDSCSMEIRVGQSFTQKAQRLGQIANLPHRAQRLGQIANLPHRAQRRDCILGCFA